MSTRRPFATVMQGVLIVLLVISLVLIAQQAIRPLSVGFLLLVVSAIVQIGFGNVPPTADFKKSMGLLGLYLLLLRPCSGWASSWPRL